LRRNQGLSKNSFHDFFDNPSRNFSSRDRDVFARLFFKNRVELLQKTKFSRKSGGIPPTRFAYTACIPAISQQEQAKNALANLRTRIIQRFLKFRFLKN
jgi:hypothetical protein